MSKTVEIIISKKVWAPVVHQDMLVTCEEYAKEHNLKFSTDPVNPRKSKTKCLACKDPRGSLFESRRGSGRVGQ